MEFLQKTERYESICFRSFVLNANVTVNPDLRCADGVSKRQIGVWMTLRLLRGCAQFRFAGENLTSRVKEQRHKAWLTSFEASSLALPASTGGRPKSSMKAPMWSKHIKYRPMSCAVGWLLVWNIAAKCHVCWAKKILGLALKLQTGLPMFSSPSVHSQMSHQSTTRLWSLCTAFLKVPFALPLPCLSLPDSNRSGVAWRACYVIPDQRRMYELLFILLLRFLYFPARAVLPHHDPWFVCSSKRNVFWTCTWEKTARVLLMVARYTKECTSTDLWLRRLTGIDSLKYILGT
jgi:hypothetical protein